MSDNFHALFSSHEMRQAQQVAYSLEMVADIASAYDSSVDGHDYATARCMLDAFYVHVRLLADFLVRRTKSTDIGPRDFVKAWQVPKLPAATRLAQYWDIASKYVVHFGRPRVPHSLDDLEAFRVGGEPFKAMAADVLIVFSVFMRQLEAETPSWDGESVIPDRQNEPEKWTARNLAERTKLLHQAFVTACSKIGHDDAEIAVSNCLRQGRLPSP